MSLSSAPVNVPQAVQDLIRKFADNTDFYRSLSYNETQCRIDFINPLFEVLGLDMANRAGYADAYRDVIHEDAIRIGGATEAPDYGFRIGGTRELFLEVKLSSRYDDSCPLESTTLKKVAPSTNADPVSGGHAPPLFALPCPPTILTDIDTGGVSR